MAKVHVNIRIFGDVQGVSFRYGAKREADRLGVRGFARNEKDGTVYVEAEGDEKIVGDFLKWCRQGPAYARIDRVETQEGEIKDFPDFSVCTPV